MQISLDDGKTWQTVEGNVRLCCEHVNIPGEEFLGEVHLNVSDNGIITDVWASKQEPGALDYNIGTECETIVELAGRLVEENA